MTSILMMVALSMPGQCSGAGCSFAPARAVGRMVAAPFRAAGRGTRMVARSTVRDTTVMVRAPGRVFRGPVFRARAYRQPYGYYEGVYMPTYDQNVAWPSPQYTPARILTPSERLQQNGWPRNVYPQ